MSRENIGTRRSRCKCGSGYVEEQVYGDDWNRISSEYSLECPECLKHYHLESRNIVKPDGENYALQYLVKNGMTLNVKIKQAESFQEDICSHFTLKELTASLEEIRDQTAIAKVEGYMTRRIIRCYKNWHKPARINDIRQAVIVAIGSYTEYPYNKEAIETEEKFLLDEAGDPLRFENYIEAHSAR